MKRSWSESMLDVISRKSWMSVCAVVLVMSASLVSQTVPQTTQRPNRITQDVASGGFVAVAGTVHPLTQRATDMGAVNSAMQLDTLTLNIGLSAAQQTELNALTDAQQNRKSPQYHQWLTQAEYGARFGLTDADLSKVTGWLTGQGFTVKSVSKSRNAIYFGGKAWQVESAFHTQLHQFQVDGETHFANTTELRVPAAMGSVMVEVRGLNNFRLKPHVQKQITPDFTYSTSQHFLTPGDWATIYDVTPIYVAGFTGTGTHVGVVGQTYAPQADIDHFRTASGLGTTNITYVCIDTTVAHCTGTAAISTTGDLGEADLDIEWAGGVAKNATVDYVYAPFSDVTSNTFNVFDALQYAVQTYTILPSLTAVLPVISMSYTDCEANLFTNGILNSEATFVTSIGQQAQAQGQTIVVASGDTGVAGCDTQGAPGTDTATGGAWASVPLDSPFYTGVGGTTLNGDESAPANFWNQQLNLANSALQYIPETVWNDTNTTNGLSASGGGVSQVYAQPTWQSGLISGQTKWRMLPDVAFAASANHDGYMNCSADNNTVARGTMCANGTFYSSGSGNNSVFFVAGGTSASAPAFAGMLTLLVQQQGSGLGNINPTLYGFAKTNAAVFHDITTGNNIVPCTVATTDPGCVGSTMGSSATAGYDLTTGLGSIDGNQLSAALAGISVAPLGSYTFAASANSPTLAAGSILPVTLTLSPTNYTGTVTLVASSSSPNVTAILSSNSISMASGAQTPTLTITTSAGAKNHAPATPWSGGALVLCAVLLGAPFTLRRKRALAVLLTALAIAGAGFLMACGGGSSKSSTPIPAARTYLVTVTATGSGSVANPLPVMITVTVP